jgi:hypothetical protein
MYNVTLRRVHESIVAVEKVSRISVCERECLCRGVGVWPYLSSIQRAFAVLSSAAS